MVLADTSPGAPAPQGGPSAVPGRPGSGASSPWSLTEIRQALQLLVDTFDPTCWSLADAEAQVVDFTVIERLGGVGKALAAHRVATVRDRSGDGPGSTARWLAEVTGGTQGEARSTLQLGAGLDATAPPCPGRPGGAPSPRPGRPGSWRPLRPIRPRRRSWSTPPSTGPTATTATAVPGPRPRDAPGRTTGPATGGSWASGPCGTGRTTRGCAASRPPSPPRTGPSSSPGCGPRPSGSSPRPAREGRRTPVRPTWPTPGGPGVRGPLPRHRLPRHRLPRHRLPRHRLPRHRLPRHWLPRHWKPRHRQPRIRTGCPPGGPPHVPSGGPSGAGSPSGGPSGADSPSGDLPDRVVCGPRARVELRLSVESLRRGSVNDGEVCDLAGVGPVSLETARDLLGDSLVQLVISDGADVRWISSRKRTIPAAVRAALLARDDRRCAVPGCGARWDWRSTTGRWPSPTAGPPNCRIWPCCAGPTTGSRPIGGSDSTGVRGPGGGCRRPGGPTWPVLHRSAPTGAPATPREMGRPRGFRLE